MMEVDYAYKTNKKTRISTKDFLTLIIIQCNKLGGINHESKNSGET